MGSRNKKVWFWLFLFPLSWVLPYYTLPYLTTARLGLNVDSRIQNCLWLFLAGGASFVFLCFCVCVSCFRIQKLLQALPALRPTPKTSTPSSTPSSSSSTSWHSSAPSSQRPQWLRLRSVTVTAQIEIW